MKYSFLDLPLYFLPNCNKTTCPNPDNQYDLATQSPKTVTMLQLVNTPKWGTEQKEKTQILNICKKMQKTIDCFNLLAQGVAHMQHQVRWITVETEL